MQYTVTSCQQLNQFYKQNKDKARARPQDLMYAAFNKDGGMCAALRLLTYDDVLFLRSVLTANDYRNKGIASNLIKHAIEQQSCLVYTLPTQSALSLYLRLGFQTVSKQEFPAQLLANHRRFQRFNNDSTIMVIDSRLR
ncbi:MAG: N-acetylglutamate synthase-like GNAT family acetyltransferase [Oleispira sp.]|jgi:N-acetylglutamate synthase-like GNAT family acetyltransferase